MLEPPTGEWAAGILTDGLARPELLKSFGNLDRQAGKIMPVISIARLSTREQGGLIQSL
jgi:hypothetical protein